MSTTKWKFAKVSKLCSTSEGFQVTLAETGEAGLQRLEEQPFDLVLLDVSLPDRNGLDLLREIHQRDPQSLRSS